MPYLDTAAENFVLGQRSGFGADKAYKKSSKKKRQDDLVSYLLEAGKEQNRTDNINAQMPRDPNVLQSLKQEQFQIPYTYSDEYFADRSLNRGVMDSSTLPTSWTGRRKGKYQREQSMANRFGSNSDIQDAMSKGVMRIDPLTGAPRFSNTAEQPRPEIAIGDVLKEVGKLTAEDFAVGMSRLGKRGAAAVGQAIDYTNDGKSNYSDSFGEKANTANAFAYTGGGRLANQTEFKGAVNTGSTDLRGTLTDVLNGPGMALGFGLEGAVASGGLRAARAAMAAAKASGLGGDLARGTKMGLSMVGGLGTGGVGGVPLSLAKKVNKARANSFLDDGTEVFNDAERASENAAIDELSRSTETMANKQGIPISDVATKMRERATGTVWDTHVYNPETQTYTIEITGRDLDREGIKMAAYNTLVGGAERQKKYGNSIDELPNSPDDIPDEFVDRILKSYQGHHRVADSQGRNMAHYGLTLDHNISLKKGGANTLDNLVAMLGKTNFGKGG